MGCHACLEMGGVGTVINYMAIDIIKRIVGLSYYGYSCVTKWIKYSPPLYLSLSVSFSLSLSPSLSLSFSLSPPSLSYRSFSLPWPLRLLETDQCIVELQMTSTIDLESEYHECYSNYHATMTWYSQNGTQSRLDIRKHIRK